MNLTTEVVGRSATLSLRQAAWALGVPTSAIQRAIRVGALRAVCRTGRPVVVREIDVRRLMCGSAA